MNIDNIRHLLAAYYDGTATGAEVNALKRYFMEAQDIPEDLRVDAAIFRAMSEQTPAVVPTDLKQRIIDATTGAKPRRRFKLIPRAAVAAAASLAILLAAAAMLLTGQNEPKDDTRLAVATPGTITSVTPDTSVTTVTEISSIDNSDAPKSQPDRQTNPGQTEAKALAKTLAKAEVKPSVKEHTKTRDPYREVTDAEQVVEITQDIMDKLTESLSLANKGLRHTHVAMAIVRNPLDASKIRDEYNK